MDYHIYLDGEKCGELTGAENARLRKEAKRDARTWGAFLFAQLAGTWKVVCFYVRMLGLVGGLGILMAATFAPQIQQSTQGMTPEEIAFGIRTAAIYLSMTAALSVAGCLLFSPRCSASPMFSRTSFCGGSGC